MGKVSTGLRAPAPNDLITVKLGTDTVANGGDMNGNDVGKPVKWAADGRMVLCSDGDLFDGILVSVESWTDDGYAVGTVAAGVGTRVKVEADGAITYGAFVEAAAPQAAKTAETGAGYGKVSAHTAAAADTSRWRLIGGTGGDETVCVIEKLF